MLLQAILIAIWSGICGIEQFDGLESLHRPIVSGLVIGLILGDVKTGLIVGGTLELVWMGLVPLAGAQPPNIVVGGVVGVSLAILSHIDPQAAVGLSFPFAVIAQMLVTLMFTVFTPVMHKADEYAKNADAKGIELINYSQLLIRFIFWGLIAFVVVYFGAERTSYLVNLMPEKLIRGFSVAGGMMPAVGFAMLLNIMLKKQYVPFLIIGFVLAAYLKLDVLAVSLVGLAIALYVYNTDKSEANNVVKEDYEDGI